MREHGQAVYGEMKRSEMCRVAFVCARLFCTKERGKGDSVREGCGW